MTTAAPPLSPLPISIFRARFESVFAGGEEEEEEEEGGAVSSWVGRDGAGRGQSLVSQSKIFGRKFLGRGKKVLLTFPQL